MEHGRSLDPRFGLGLKQNVQLLVPYNPFWVEAFNEEAAQLGPVLESVALGIEHYGSTSVPGLAAKPIIDIQVGVATMDHADTVAAQMLALGYDDAGDQGIPEHRIFGKGVERTHLVHFVIFGGDQWVRTLRFRDRLRADPKARDEYETLKRDLAATCATRAAYTAGKAAFVERLSR